MAYSRNRLLASLLTGGTSELLRRVNQTLDVEPPAALTAAPGIGGVVGLAGGDDDGGLLIDTSKKFPINSRGPRGWLAAVFAHVGQGLSFSINYMTSKRGENGNYDRGEAVTHILPTFSATRTATEKVESVDMTWKSSKLMIQRFAESPGPMFPRCSPVWLWPVEWYDGPYCEYKDAYGSRHGKNGGVGPEWDVDLAFMSPDIKWGWRSEYNLLRSRIENGDYRYREDGALELHMFDKWKPIRPARRAVQWWEGVKDDHFGHDRWSRAQLYIRELAGEGAYNRCVVVPEYFRKNTDRLLDFVRRLGMWYRSAALLIWGGELMRLHCHDLRHEPAPQWWRKHATAWAIGVPKVAMQKDRIVFPECKIFKNYSPKRDYLSPLWSDFSADETLEILRLIVAHTPVPGTKGWCGEQIAQPGKPRVLLDMPEQVGSLLPPIDLVTEDGQQWWEIYALKKWNDEQGTPTYLKVLGPIINILISIGASFGSGAISSATSAISNAATSAVVKCVANLCLQATIQLGYGRPPKIDVGDVVGLAGELVQATGLADTIGAAVIPDGMWSALTSAVGEIPEIVGVDDWDALKGSYDSLRDMLVNIRDEYDWPWLEEGFGGLAVTQEAKAAAAEALPSNTNFSNLFG